MQTDFLQMMMRQRKKRNVFGLTSRRTRSRKNLAAGKKSAKTRIMKKSWSRGSFSSSHPLLIICSQEEANAEAEAGIWRETDRQTDRQRVEGTEQENGKKKKNEE